MHVTRAGKESDTLGTTHSPDDVELQDLPKSNVPTRYQGTEADKAQMQTLGRLQETRRNFTFITILGFGSTLICTWEVVLANLLSVLTNGGTAGLFWGFTIVVIGFAFVYASLAEMSSMAPTSGGQYHWVSEFSPPGAQRYLSYMTGWLCFTGWQSGLTGIAFMSGTIMQGLLVLNDDGYMYENWHGTLLIIAITSFAVIFNTFIASKLPIVEGLVVFLHIIGLFVVIIVLWTLAPRNNAHDAFLQYTNLGGWSSDGVSLLAGLYPLVVSLLGFDSAVHMSEEISDAARTLPRSIVWSFGLNAVLGFIVVITLIFTWGDMDIIAKSPTGYPFLQIFIDTTKSYGGTNALAAIMIITLTASCIAVVATASRQIWAFARDNGVPFSSFVSHVNPRLNVPVNAVIVSLVVTALLSLINIGSSVALNAILSLNCASLLLSYIICISCVIIKRLRHEPLPPRPWSLGKAGIYINIASIVWLVPIFIFTLFPGVTPVTPSSMNWGVLLFGFMVGFSTFYYFVSGRKHYISPKERVKRDLQ